MKYWVELPEVWATEFLQHDPHCHGYWISSLTQSWQKGYADNCTLGWNNYVDLVRRLRLQSDKKIIVDVDMLFNEPSIAATIAKELYHVGCNTIVVESKRFPKVNSLTPESMNLSTPEEFARLLNKVKSTVPELEIIARNEYLASTRDVDFTYKIAKRALDAGADGVVVHWGADNDTSLLKQTLSRLKADGVTTGIIPTKYLDQVNQGDFEELADFSILGNICSSFIRHSFSQQTVKSLLQTPSMFHAILDRVNSHEPSGQSSLIVLGAVADNAGNYLLEDEQVRQRFLQYQDQYYRIILVVDEQCQLPDLPEQVHIARIKGSMGEVHSLSVALEFLHTEHVCVAYADIDDFALQNLDAEGLLFHGDVFAGVMNCRSDILLSMIEQQDPASSLLMMALRHGVKSTLKLK